MIVSMAAEGSGENQASAGQATWEYVGLILLVAAIIAGLLAGPGRGIGTAVAARLCAAVSTIAGHVRCASPGDGEDGDHGKNAVVTRIRQHQQRRAPFVYQHGGFYTATEARIRALLRQGRVDDAARLDRLLDYYIELARRGERGALLNRLWAADEQEFQRMLQRGSVSIPNPRYPDDGSRRDSIRYFKIPPKPGGGVVVVDFFIPGETSGDIPPANFLAGDDRGHRDPLSQTLSRNRSRMMVVIDQETGRGLIYVSHSCTTNMGPLNACNNARPIAFPEDGAWMEDPANDDIDYDEANQFDVSSNGEGEIVLHYDALNSITPLVFSVDGTMAIDRGLDWPPVRKNVDGYPSVGWWHYDPATGQATQFERQDAGPVMTNAPGGQRDGLPTILAPEPLGG